MVTFRKEISENDNPSVFPGTIEIWQTCMKSSVQHLEQTTWNKSLITIYIVCN